ncbi:hypothetical protein [Micromonospora ureilytica]|uniref:ImmA/IrrE family metallo-endopeptidase n=1 Tax=Micromonospora ureilytica TaxID=709868 RepID=UPI002E0EC270|nr:hypothetical protein OHB55_28845 [Micromonospora ureilytica]
MTDSPRFRIEWEWEAAPSMRSAELRSTFARLKIHIDDECLTLVEDRESGSSRRAIACSLYPLAEWVAYNWWFLQTDSRPASSLVALRSGRELSPNEQRRWRRHALRDAGDGFLWPNLFIVPIGASTTLLWRSDKAASKARPIRFLTQGEVSVDSAEVQQVFGNLIEAVIERLVDCGIESSRLSEEWSAIQSADPEEKEYCRAAARLGLDPYSEAAKYEDAILRASTELEQGLLNEFLSVANPDKILDDLDWIARARQEMASLSSPNTTLADLRGDVLASRRGVHPMAPWEQGYSDARALRETIGINPTERFTFDGYLSRRIVDAPDRSLHAIGGGRSLTSSVVLGRRQLEDSERFTLARAFWNLLHRPDEQFLITPAHSARQKTERAFAAELLAPAEGVAQLIGNDPSDIGVDELESAERHFGVSSLIIQYQIDNQLTSA